jgi:hypothetical protein
VRGLIGDDQKALPFSFLPRLFLFNITFCLFIFITCFHCMCVDLCCANSVSCICCPHLQEGKSVLDLAKKNSKHDVVQLIEVRFANTRIDAIRDSHLFVLFVHSGFWCDTSGHFLLCFSHSLPLFCSFEIFVYIVALRPPLHLALC